MKAEPKNYQAMTDAEKIAALAPHSIVMASALEQIYSSLSRYVPGGRTPRRWVAERLVRKDTITEGERWDAEAFQAVIDALDAIGSGGVL